MHQLRCEMNPEYSVHRHT